jgi:hypothetical protein
MIGPIVVSFALGVLATGLLLFVLLKRTLRPQISTSASQASTSASRPASTPASPSRRSSAAADAYDGVPRTPREYLSSLHKIPASVVVEATPSTLVALCGYDPSSEEHLPALRSFSPIKENTHCVFARKARVWGSYRQAPHKVAEAVLP